MKKIILTALAATALLGSCAQVTQEDYKEAFLSQLDEFVNSSDLSDSLGLSTEQQDSIMSQLKDYVDSYEPNEEELAQTKQAVTELLENNEGLTLEEIEDKIASLLKEE